MWLLAELKCHVTKQACAILLCPRLRPACLVHTHIFARPFLPQPASPCWWTYTNLLVEDEPRPWSQLKASRSNSPVLPWYWLQLDHQFPGSETERPPACASTLQALWKPLSCPRPYSPSCHLCVRDRPSHSPGPTIKHQLPWQSSFITPKQRWVPQRLFLDLFFLP